MPMKKGSAYLSPMLRALIWNRLQNLRPDRGFLSGFSLSLERLQNGRCPESLAATREMAVDLMAAAKQLGLKPYGVSFHVGSQQKEVTVLAHGIGRSQTGL